MVQKGHSGPVIEDEGMFDIKAISNTNSLTNVVEQNPNVVAESDDSDDETPKPKYQKYDKESTRLDSSGRYYKDSDSEIEMESDDGNEDDPKEGLGLTDSEDEQDKPKKKSKRPKAKEDSDHPLLTDLDYRNKEEKNTSKARLWFERDAFKNLIDEKVEDADLDHLISDYKKKGGTILGKEGQSINTAKDSAYDSGSSGEDSDYDVEKEVKQKKKKKSEKAGFEIVKEGTTGMKEVSD